MGLNISNVLRCSTIIIAICCSICIMPLSCQNRCLNLVLRFCSVSIHSKCAMCVSFCVLRLTESPYCDTFRTHGGSLQHTRQWQKKIPVHADPVCGETFKHACTTEWSAHRSAHDEKPSANHSIPAFSSRGGARVLRFVPVGNGKPKAFAICLTILCIIR